MIARFLIFTFAFASLAGCTRDSSDRDATPNLHNDDTINRDQPPLDVLDFADQLPKQSTAGGYTSSDKCKSCHKGEYESWHDSYHRTMTQVASPASVLGDFDNVKLAWNVPEPVYSPGGTPPVVQHEYLLHTRGDQYWVRTKMIDAAGRSFDASEDQIVMTTGSHHYQIYWTSPNPDRMLVVFPFVFLKEEGRWVTRESALVAPPASYQRQVAWNANCMRCHSTHGQPRIDVSNGTADTHVAELGISCQACHGPGEEHIASRQRGEKGPPMVNPAELTAPRSAQVCGQCHSIATFADRDWNHGFWNRVKPGDDLHANRNIVQFGHPETLEEVHRQYHNQATQSNVANEAFEQFKRDRFWADGKLRTTGREYNSITQTKCYEGGQLSCLSCHSMHDNEGADDQLAEGMRGDAACVQCHKEEKFSANIEAHTHHAASSSGSRCNNCHMPHTSYGLLKAIRSHDIDSPSVKNTIDTGRPIACNQCHLDKTLDWTQQNLTKWNLNTPQAELTDDQKEISATILWLTQGDAGQRALAAWTMGWDEAQAASGKDWLAPYLASMLDDPYTAVRYVAARSLRTLDGFEDFKFDFVADAATLKKDRNRAIEDWQGLRTADYPDHVLIDPNNSVDWGTFERLIGRRDNRPVNLAE